jgi:hypothetical protein
MITTLFKRSQLTLIEVSSPAGFPVSGQTPGSSAQIGENFQKLRRHFGAEGHLLASSWV